VIQWPAQWNNIGQNGILQRPQNQMAQGISGSQLRFVVQHHAARSDHYDFRLEWDGVLLSWAVPKGPSYNPQDKRLAVEVEAHPLDYIDFEGAIPKGEYGGGVVMVWDEGEWEPRSDVEQGLAEGSLKMVLKGKRLNGKWALVRLKKQGKGQPNWLLIKEKDEYVREDAGIAEYTTSVRSGRTMAEIEAGHVAVPEKDEKIPFAAAAVQLAKLARHVPTEGDWLYELKYDGFRILAYIEGGHVRLMTRNRQDYTEKFPEIAQALEDWSAGRAMVLDGEVVVLDPDGRSDFQALQGYLQEAKGQDLTYVVFDLLALGSDDLRMKPLQERKAKLTELMPAGHPRLHYSQHTEGDGRDIFLTACRANREGVIAKRADSVYSGTRNGDWLKIKCENRQEFVIGGYTQTDKRSVGALLLGVYDGEDLVYAGRAGTGFTEKTVADLERRFAKMRRATAPFKEAPRKRRGEAIIWVNPQLVAEIRFSEWTEDQRLRQASFKGLRFDKEAQEVQREAEAETHALSTNPDEGTGNTGSGQRQAEKYLDS
jgi:bifunctional non-homologous end joining protein LigD